jgi:hypothetical protein
MEAYAVRVAAGAAEAAADSLLALDENAPVDNVEGGEVAVEDPGHFDSAKDGAQMVREALRDVVTFYEGNVEAWSTLIAFLSSPIFKLDDNVRTTALADI